MYKLGSYLCSVMFLLITETVCSRNLHTNTLSLESAACTNDIQGLGTMDKQALLDHLVNFPPLSKSIFIAEVSRQNIYTITLGITSG